VRGAERQRRFSRGRGPDQGEVRDRG
jgi:hypothetical protein